MLKGRRRCREWCGLRGWERPWRQGQRPEIRKGGESREWGEDSCGNGETRDMFYNKSGVYSQKQCETNLRLPHKRVASFAIINQSINASWNSLVVVEFVLVVVFPNSVSSLQPPQKYPRICHVLVFAIVVQYNNLSPHNAQASQVRSMRRNGVPRGAVQTRPSLQKGPIMHSHLSQSRLDPRW